MKLDILIIDIALVALIVIPYILFILIGRREHNNLKNKFLNEAKYHQLRCEEVDTWNKNMMGLDKVRQKILLVQRRQTEFVTVLIELTEVKSCQILREVQTLKIDKRTEDILQRIHLQLILFNGSEKSVSLYNCDDTYYQEYELLHAERWNSSINALISFRPTINSAA
ncbi:hypothetical protein [Salinimicrobium xinjiangense]|uniref:hypothetical protein n=1 Tax=Salinimicrobium xinjiangense TaxID=438596 RepID=UPI000427BC52|nr:hypothetical protein [Salinimicrobium xinjiangense]